MWVEFDWDWRATQLYFRVSVSLTVEFYLLERIQILFAPLDTLLLRAVCDGLLSSSSWWFISFGSRRLPFNRTRSTMPLLINRIYAARCTSVRCILTDSWQISSDKSPWVWCSNERTSIEFDCSRRMLIWRNIHGIKQPVSKYCAMLSSCVSVQIVLCSQITLVLIHICNKARSNRWTRVRALSLHSCLLSSHTYWCCFDSR